MLRWSRPKDLFQKPRPVRVIGDLIYEMRSWDFDFWVERRSLGASEKERFLRLARPLIYACPKLGHERFLAFPLPAAILLAMSDATCILSQFERGDPHAAEQQLPLVYEELRKLAAAKLAQEKPGHLICLPLSI